MNKAILLGRLTRDTEVRYSQGDNPVAVVRFNIAVNRKFKKENEPEADFLNCITFGKTGEFVSKHFSKGDMIGIVGRIQTGSYTNKQGNKVYTTEIFVEEVNFTGKAKKENNSNNSNNSNAEDNGNEMVESYEQYCGDEDDDDTLPF